MSVKHHRHHFHALWWNLGPHGRQDIHIHSCEADDCDRVLVGMGRDCSGAEQPHQKTTLTEEGFRPKLV